MLTDLCDAKLIASLSVFVFWGRVSFFFQKKNTKTAKRPSGLSLFEKTKKKNMSVIFYYVRDQVFLHKE